MHEEKYVSSECNKMNVNVNIFLIRKHARFTCSAPKYFHILIPHQAYQLLVDWDHLEIQVGLELELELSAEILS